MTLIEMQCYCWGRFIWYQLRHHDKLLLWVVGLLLRRGLRVTRVRLSSRGRSWVATLSWSGRVGNIGYVVLPVGIGIVAHRHLIVPACKENKLFKQPF